jgi:hypothetical protein
MRPWDRFEFLSTSLVAATLFVQLIRCELVLFRILVVFMAWRDLRFARIGVRAWVLTNLFR